MNRSLTNVLFGGIASQAQTQRKIEGEVTQTSVDDIVDALINAENVIIVCVAITNRCLVPLTSVRSWATGWLLPKRNTLSLKSLACYEPKAST
jgi:hypothetical protein